MSRNTLHEKKRIVIIGVILILFLIPLIFSSDACNHNPKVLKELNGIIVTTGGDFPESEGDFPELDKWVEALEKAISLLPPPVLTKITPKFDEEGKVVPLTINFWPEKEESKNPTSEYSYHVYWGEYFSGGNFIRIFHEIANENKIDSPPVSVEVLELYKSRYSTDLGRMYLFIHEIGHSWDHPIFTIKNIHISDSREYEEIIEKEKGPSLYAYQQGVRVRPEDKRVIGRDSPAIMEIDGELWLINSQEDFADSFAMYVLFPEYLKQNFPLRYDWFKNKVFLKEYDRNFSTVPDWIIKTKFTVPYP